MNLEIERVDVFGVAVPLIGEYKNFKTSRSIQRSAIVRITATGGAVGLGSCEVGLSGVDHSTSTVEDDLLRLLGTTLAPLVIGMDPTNVHRVLEKIEPAIEGFLNARAAIEMACIDLAARLAGVPVHTYLGGAVRDRLLFNAWIGIMPPDETAREAIDWKNRGFRSAKIKVSGNIETVRDRVKAVREAVGPEFQIRVDTNGSYDADTAIKLARLMAPYNLQLFEQPVPAHDISGMARVRREANALGMPVMADESVRDFASLIRIIKLEAADAVQLKILKVGGLFKLQRMIAAAEAAGIRCVVGHGFALSISTMAEIMLAATSKNVIDGLECAGPLKIADDIVTHKLDLSSGSLPLPRDAGLGMVLDEAKINRYQKK